MLCFYLSFLDEDQDTLVFTNLYDTYHLALEKVSLGILREQKDVEDALQNTWMQVLKHFSKISQIPCEELRFWLISIVKNESLMILRKKKTTLPQEDWAKVSRESPDHYEDLVSLFQKLPETYRATLEMKFILGYHDKEIADALGISETAVSTRIHRGRTLLQKILEQEGFVYDRR